MINIDSLANDNSIEEFNELRKAKSISQYRLIIFFLAIVNICFIAFFICFKLQINTLENTNSSLSLHINQKEFNNSHIRTVVDHKLINLHTLQHVFQKEEISLIYSIEEFNTILSWMHSKCSQIFLCFTTNTLPSFSSYDIFEYCNKNNFLMFIIKTTKGHRFGGAVKTYEYSTNEIDTNTFLFNLDTKRKFEIKESGEDLFYVGWQDVKISFGEDLVIHRDFLQSNSSYSKFPLKYGGVNDTLADLTGGEDYFGIEQLEIIDSL